MSLSSSDYETFFTDMQETRFKPTKKYWWWYFIFYIIQWTRKVSIYVWINLCFHLLSSFTFSGWKTWDKSMSRKKTIKRRTYETNGPYDVFHIDRNDKLKMFGFTIHGFDLAYCFNHEQWSSCSCKLLSYSYYKFGQSTKYIYCEELQVFFTKNSDSFLYAASKGTSKQKHFVLGLNNLIFLGG